MRHSAEDYTEFTVDYLLPMFEQLKREGKIKLGKKTIRISSRGLTWEYEGYLNDEGQATGYGSAI